MVAMDLEIYIVVALRFVLLLAANGCGYRRMKKFFLPVAALAILSALSAHAAEFPTSTPITSIPVTITKPGNYYFVANMYVTNGATAITVNAPGPVTIDMRGFSLTGAIPGSGPFGVSGGGVHIESSNVEILNGTIVGGFNGVAAYSTTSQPSPYLSGIVLEKLTFKQQASNSLNFFNINNSLVKDCDFTQGEDGIGEGGAVDGIIADEGSQTGNRYVNDLIVQSPNITGAVNSPNLILNIVPQKNISLAPEFPTKSTPITTLPLIITKPGNYYFVENMYFAVTPVVGQSGTTPAITVNAPGPVAIDMRGFTLSGPGQQFLNGFYTNPVGIVIDSSNVTILNGSLEGFLNGIFASGSNTSYLSRIDLANITFINGAQFGCVGFSYVNNSVVRNCDFSQKVGQVPADPAIGDGHSQTGNAYVNDLFNTQRPFNIGGSVNSPNLILNITPVR
jgi:hypothetical protein